MCPVQRLQTGCASPGGKVSRDAGPVKGGDSIIAFVDDPTGYKWEIIGSKGKPIPEPIAQACCSPTSPARNLLIRQCTCAAQRC